MDLKDASLKVTPQRLAVLEALNNLTGHPTAERIKEYVLRNHPNIAVGTIYKTLDTFEKRGLIKRVKTENDIMRYDAIAERHHHLYSEDSERIEDFYDSDLNEMLQEYFRKKKIPNFKIKDIRLQIIGEFKEKNS